VDAPTQIQFTPTDQHIDAYIQKIRPLAEADVSGEEADIFDAEVIDDEED
jgi:acid stress-induced BolA-like protein IbaG/YrbA